MTEAIVLAGGLGTRLGGVLGELPKPMAPIAGQPFLTYLLRFLELHGIRRAILAVGHQQEVIRRFFGPRFGRIEIRYSLEDEPLGTGGALLQALQQVEDSFAFVFNGDTFLRLDCRQMAAVAKRQPDVQLVVALRRVSDACRYGTVLVAGGRIQAFCAHGTPGPGLINAGSYLVSRNIFDGYRLPRKFSWERFLEERVAEIRPLAYECDVPFIDIGIPEALDQAQTLIPQWTLDLPTHDGAPTDPSGKVVTSSSGVD
ncbi:MAG TPA: nucleotidyltransferase family protein [Bryobacteraceae bacterium]|nr:nucleotidyltransferase family protein [Bryobacteraceae bacterium]